jgi:hypothetical protein
LLTEAERAASTGDLASAEELLREAALLQEAELGPSHPDLANTLNNLAVVAEKTGRLDEAEACYRRAVAIASTSLPPDDPMVTASRQNLEDFCHAHGRPIDKPAAIATTDRAAAEKPPPLPTASPPPLVSRPASRAPAALAIAAVGLAIAALIITRPWSPRHASTPIPTTAPAPAPPVEPAQPASGAPASIERPPAPTVDRAPARPPTPAGISLATVRLCRNLSTSDWRCDPAGESVAPGALVLYTRVRSPHDGVVIHRWYRGDTLRKTAQLRIVPNQAEGYRTYSRQTVDRGDWRVEVRSADGQLLHEQRFVVR